MIDDTVSYTKKHPEHRHRETPWSEDDGRRLISVWRALLESQNGQGVDGCGNTPEDGWTAGRILRDHVPPGSRVLFLGAGRGQEVDHAILNGYDAVGSTLGPMNVEIARETFGITLRFEDAHCSAIPKASFDAIVGLHVLEHSPAPIILALSCARALRPGGTVVFETPSSKYHSGGRYMHHVLCPTPRQASVLLEKSGFDNVKQWFGADLVTEKNCDRGDIAADLLTVGRRVSPGSTSVLDPTTRLILDA